MINDIGVIRTLFEIQRSTNIQIEVTYWYYDKTDIESFKIECAKLNDQTIYKYTGENKIIKLAGAKILLCEFVGSKIVLNVPNASQSRYELEVKFSSVREHSLYNGLMNFNLSDFTTPVDIPNNLKQFIWKAKFGNNLIVACQYHLCPLYHEKLNFKDKDKIANNQWTVVPKWIIKFVDPYKNISNLKTEFKKICIDDLIIIHTFCSKHYDKFWQDNVFAYK
ncbi:hypothetical protein S100390_v1c08590 [Spiroplasma sp. NBRC 100390]|uniref:hypothetical protein n=1 Tax=unclassified Spiroplasma TaxID=2637901 RepID=UPI000892997C|nr:MULTISPECIES: hypothetical protein [unclassified Spiroplasma]AOX44195.1 hypothetical protein STU14_v1c08590 [Spiroplasma sp. TU-14]APE13665.1 hypothetical protein S100390_v1c08590 [Spiroplasma sp. NBRC 100390]